MKCLFKHKNEKQCRDLSSRSPTGHRAFPPVPGGECSVPADYGGLTDSGLGQSPLAGSGLGAQGSLPDHISGPGPHFRTRGQRPQAAAERPCSASPPSAATLRPRLPGGGRTYLQRGPGAFRHAVSILSRDDSAGKGRPGHRSDSYRRGTTQTIACCRLESKCEGDLGSYGTKLDR